jgi:hypothetical protein
MRDLGERIGPKSNRRDAHPAREVITVSRYFVRIPLSLPATLAFDRTTQKLRNLQRTGLRASAQNLLSKSRTFSFMI